MSNYIRNVLKLPKLIQLFKKNHLFQKRFLKQTVLKDLQLLQPNDTNDLSKADTLKIESYYGNAVASVLGEGFCILRGAEMTNRERISLTYLGALTGIFDDFFDELNTPHQHIKLLIEEPKLSHAQNSHEKLFVTFWKKAINQLPNHGETKQVFYRVFDAQIASKKQHNGQLSKEEIKQITFEKGAASIQFYRTVFGEIKTKFEYELIEKIGHIGQLENDIFDIYKDNKKNILTLVTKCNHIDEIRELYLAIFNQIKNLIYRTNYTQNDKEAFLRFITAIVSRGFVCLDFLEKNEKDTTGFQPQNYLRKTLVCDMEKPLNKLYNLHYYARLA